MNRKILIATMVCLIAAATAPIYGQNGSVAGCLTRDGAQYALGVIPSGQTYQLQGNISALIGHTEQLVRLSGDSLRPPAGNQAGLFSFKGLTVLAETCTAFLPPQNAEIHPVTGTTAPNAIAVNTGTTENPVPPSASAPRGLLTPPNWNEIGQNEQTANTDATAATLAEEYPSYTLGVNALPSYANPQQPLAQSATQVNTQ